ncbi:unnamed protein product [Toxocara canis]|uniref:Myb_DNA-bind_5 domain-containing protein n=1 Tax=Toxocara canis TaxID=6265 RepID=A0A183V7U1_TOXCA|nr:unnamed protein product [Toxocara canis]
MWIAANERNRFIVTLIRDELARTGEALFEHSNSASNAWKRMEEALLKRGWQVAPGCANLRHEFIKRLSCLQNNQRNYATKGKRLVLNDVEAAIEELQEVYERATDRENRRRNADILELAMVLEKRGTGLRSYRWKEISAMLSVGNHLRRKTNSTLCIHSLLSNAKLHYERYRSGIARKPLSEAEKIFLRLQGITFHPESSFSPVPHGVSSRDGIGNRAPLDSLENLPHIQEAMKEDNAAIVGPSRISKRHRSSTFGHTENDLAEIGDCEDDPEEFAKRKRIEDEDHLLKETEAKFGKRPEYGTRAYFEWMGLLYGMPPTGSVPELKDSSSDEEDEEDSDEEEQEETVKEGKDELQQGTLLWAQTSMATIQQPSAVISNSLSTTFSDGVSDWLTAITTEIQQQVIEPPKMGRKELNEIEQQLKIEEMELKIELLKVKTRQVIFFLLLQR